MRGANSFAEFGPQLFIYKFVSEYDNVQSPRAMINGCK